MCKVVFLHICVLVVTISRKRKTRLVSGLSPLCESTTIQSQHFQCKTNKQVAELPHLTHLWPPPVPCQPAAGDAFPTTASATCPSSDNSLGPFTSPFPCFSETPLSTAACRKAVQVLLHNHVFPDLWCLLC